MFPPAVVDAVADWSAWGVEVLIIFPVKLAAAMLDFASALLELAYVLLLVVWMLLRVAWRICRDRVKRFFSHRAEQLLPL